MSTYYVYLRGKAKWSQRLQGAGDTEFQCWNTNLYPDQESKDIFLKLKETTPTGVEGIMNALKHDEDGDFISLKRPFFIKVKGQQVPMAPPLVLDKDNQPFNGLIGNGSDITCKVMVYQHRKMRPGTKGQALRLEAVRVDNLVEFTRDNYTENEQRQVKGLPDQPGQPF